MFHSLQPLCSLQRKGMHIVLVDLSSRRLLYERLGCLSSSMLHYDASWNPIAFA